MKRITILLLLALFLLSACGVKEDYSSELEVEVEAPDVISAFEAVPVGPVYPLVEEPASLSVLYPADVEEISEGTKQLADAFTDETGITLKLQPVAANVYLSDLTTILSAGDVPDLLYDPPGYLMDTDQMDVILPLEDLIEEYAPNYLRAANGCYDGLQALIEENGHIMRMYQFYDSPQFIPALGVAIRQDWLEELEMDPPETYDDYHDLLLAMKNRYGCKLPFRMLPAGITGADNFTAGFGVSVGARTAAQGFYQVDGVVHYGLLERGFEDYITTMRTWYDEGLITVAYRDIVDLGSNSYLIELSTGESGVFFLPLESFDLLSGMCDFPITAGMDPVTETGAVSHLAPRRATSIAGAGISITELCQSPELAVQAADWFYSDTATMIGNYGIEGKTYTLQDSTPEYTDLALKDLANLTASLQGVWATAREKVFQEEYLDVLAVWTRQKDTDYMLPDLHFGTKAQDAYELLMLDINSYADGCVAQLVSGDMPISEIPAIRERLKELHIDEALSIWQKALDNYK